MDTWLIGNNSVSLVAFESDGKYCWEIGDIEDTFREEIPKELYDALVKYETERKGPF